MRWLLPGRVSRRHTEEDVEQAPRARNEPVARQTPRYVEHLPRLGGRAIGAPLLTALQRMAGNRVVQRLTQKDAFVAPSAVERELEDQRRQGTPLPDPARAQMEHSLGRDLGAVRIHRDAKAAGLAQQLEARAFTQGNDIFFGEGEFAPDTQDGRRVLAHELTHVMQQHSGPMLVVGGVDDPAEREADEVAERVVSKAVLDGSRPVIARQEDDEEEVLPLRRQEDDEEEEARALRRQPEEDEEERVQTMRRTVVGHGGALAPISASGQFEHALARRVPRRGRAPSTGRISNRAGGTDWYNLAGDTLTEVYEQLDPDEWGRCDVNYAVTFTSREGVITAVNIVVTDRYHMPRWQGRGYNRASRAAKAEWRRMLSALWTHEHGHRDIGRREAATIQAGLLGQAEGDFETRLGELESAAQGLQDAYDVETQHGQTQGVSLDTSIQ